MGTDEPSVFEEKSNIKMIGFDMIKRISDRLYKNTGLGPNDVQVTFWLLFFDFLKADITD